MTYRDYIITHAGANLWTYHHEDYDGAPNEVGQQPADKRCGWTTSLEAAKAEIDEKIADAICPE